MNNLITDIRKTLSNFERSNTQNNSQLQDYIDDQILDCNIDDFKKSCIDIFLSKKKKRYLLKCDTNKYDDVDYSQYSTIHNHINTFIDIEFRSRRAHLTVIKDNVYNTTSKYSRFGKSLITLLQLIARRLSIINMPYRKLKSEVHRDKELTEYIQQVNNLILIFPVQQNYFLDMSTETYMYYFFLPGFDCLRLCVPIQLPIIDPAMCDFNRTYVWNTLGNFYQQPLYIQSSLIELMNRSCYGFSQYSDICFQIKKSTQIFQNLLLASCRFFDGPINTIQRFFRNKIKQKELLTNLRNQYLKIRKANTVLRIFGRSIIKKIKSSYLVKQEKAFTIQLWYKSIKCYHLLLAQAEYYKKFLEDRFLKKEEEKKKKEQSLKLKLALEIAKQQESHQTVSERTNKFNNNSPRWFGFNNNHSLHKLILITGETLDILDIKSCEFLSDKYFRVKSCLGKLCTITKSRQYIKFCRTHSQTKRTHKNESMEHFLSCYSPNDRTVLGYLREATLLSTICKNKWYLHLIHNFERNNELFKLE